MRHTVNVGWLANPSCAHNHLPQHMSSGVVGFSKSSRQPRWLSLLPKWRNHRHPLECVSWTKTQISIHIHVYSSKNDDLISPWPFFGQLIGNFILKRPKNMLSNTLPKHWGRDLAKICPLDKHWNSYENIDSFSKWRFSCSSGGHIGLPNDFEH